MRLVRSKRRKHRLSRKSERILFVGVLVLVAWVQQSSLRWKPTNQLQRQQAQQQTSTDPQGPATAAAGSIAGGGGEDDYRLAREESLGFFRDVPSESWIRRKLITHNRTHQMNKKLPRSPYKRPKMIQAWYQLNWDPDFSCFYEDSIGGNSDGHKWVCDPHRLNGNYVDDCLVYSFGSNKQFQFEQDLLRVAPRCEVHIFDPTNYTDAMLQHEGGILTSSNYSVTYHAWGLRPTYHTNPQDTETNIGKANQEKITDKNNNNSSSSSLVFKTLPETVQELGHVGRRLDVFKIDCEGCEWQTYRDWIQTPKDGNDQGALVDIRQILVETHEVVPVTSQFFQDIHQAGYVLFHKEPNIMFGGGICVEFSFLKLAPSYFESSPSHP